MDKIKIQLVTIWPQFRCSINYKTPTENYKENVEYECDIFDVEPFAWLQSTHWRTLASPTSFTIKIVIATFYLRIILTPEA